MRGLGYYPTLPSGFSAPTGKFDRTLNSRSEVRPAITMIREPPPDDFRVPRKWDPFEAHLKNSQYSKGSVVALVRRPYCCKIGCSGPETRAKAWPDFGGSGGLTGHVT
jgi:hypothetical protein